MQCVPLSSRMRRVPAGFPPLGASVLDAFMLQRQTMGLLCSRH